MSKNCPLTAVSLQVSKLGWTALPPRFSARVSFKGDIEEPCEISNRSDHERFGQSEEHLDGSIRAYTPEEMITRLDVDLKRAGRQTEYTKLWRVDGNIEIGRWKSVIHNHFRDNALVAEYFGSQKSKADIREELGRTDVFPQSLNLDKRVPWLCDDPRSFRVLVTHQPVILEHIPEEPVAFPYAWARSEKAEYALFDLQALELMKILGRGGYRLTFAANARFMVFDDNYLQMPIVIHRTREALDHTTEAYREFVSKVKEGDPDSPLLINLSLALPEYTLSVFLSLGDARKSWIG